MPAMTQDDEAIPRGTDDDLPEEIPLSEEEV
jgi:hypothetical protein